jgi:hypothetical protein
MFGESVRRAPAKPGQPQEEYVQTFYPGVTETAGASQLQVIAGRDMPGMDIRLRKAQVFRVRGKVTGSISPQQAGRLRVMMMPRDGFGTMFMGDMGGVIAKDGKFEINTVQPGSYMLTVANMEGMLQILAQQPFEMRNEDADDVTVSLQPTGEVRGSVKIEGEQLQQRMSGFRSHRSTVL